MAPVENVESPPLLAPGAPLPIPIRSPCTMASAESGVSTPSPPIEDHNNLPTNSPAPIADQSDSPLFSLSGELRNQIYRHVLHYPDSITVISTGFSVPGLLLTRKQIRTEAGNIYYAENHFRVYTSTFDSYPLPKWATLLRSQQSLLSSVSYDFSYDFVTSWPNLLLWLKRYYEGKVFDAVQRPKPEDPIRRKIEKSIMAGMFGLIKVLGRGSQAKLPWEEVEGMMLEQRKTLGDINQHWSED